MSYTRARRMSAAKALGVRSYPNGNQPEPYKNPVTSNEAPATSGIIRVDYR